MRNKFYILVLALSFSQLANAQDKVKRFCKVSFFPEANFFRIDYGQTIKANPYRDSVFIAKLKGVEGIHNLVKGLNYMTDLGWKYESNIPYDTGFRIEVLFSREFTPEELIQDIR